MKNLGIFGSVAAALFRIIPHPPNFSAIGGLSVYSGARLNGKSAIVLPLILMFVTDFLLSQIHGYKMFHETILFVYAAFLINVALGRFLLKNTDKLLSIAGVTFLASVQFFFITNLGVWMMMPIYPQTTEGLLQCYLVALPFFQYTLIGDLLFTPMLFLLHKVLEEKFSIKESLIHA